MKKVNIHSAKTHFSDYLSAVEEGETVIICRRNVPIAELKALKNETVKKKRRIGLAKGTFSLSSEFFEPLPAEIEESFLG